MWPMVGDGVAEWISAVEDLVEEIGFEQIEGAITDDDVPSGSAIKPIASIAAVESVISQSAKNRVVPVTTAEKIFSRAAVNFIAAGSAVDTVVAITAGDPRTEDESCGHRDAVIAVTCVDGQAVDGRSGAGPRESSIDVNGDRGCRGIDGDGVIGCRSADTEFTISVSCASLHWQERIDGQAAQLPSGDLSGHVVKFEVDASENSAASRFGGCRTEAGKGATGNAADLGGQGECDVVGPEDTGQHCGSDCTECAVT